MRSHTPDREGIITDIAVPELGGSGAMLPFSVSARVRPLDSFSGAHGLVRVRDDEGDEEL